MNIKPIAFVITTLIASATVWAETNDNSLILMDPNDPVIDAPIQKSRSTRAKGPMRTNFFTGFEYSDNVYELSPRGSNLNWVIADGGTRINNNLRMRYVLSQSHEDKKAKGPGEAKSDLGASTNFRIMPRYSNWVNPRFSYFIEPQYARRSTNSGAGNTEYGLNTGMQYRLGANTFFFSPSYKHLVLERYSRDNNGFNPELVSEQNKNIVSGEFNYTYRHSNKLNYGFNINGNTTLDNDSDHLEHKYTRSRAWNIRPFIRASHMYGITTEFNIKYGSQESGPNWHGSDSLDFNLNNNKQLNRNLRLVTNFGYTTAEPHSGVGWGEKEGYKVKVGLNVSF
ncbi:hypothetical protein [Photobacterium lutimaris]|uniref:Porin n=1 Tax=Photobacterium lutimaris TaxID=388278 RepID=A0A2T3IYW9_9GAMM|nr:hypothetical protein [Photobacterium lutimaris]PSU33853.1 hypothetical protein C9I99_10800 [Photobacterium lutimaris]TDR76178.1 hypothetical protein DFP78_103173 [Photobacterium lutimaris]